MAKWSNLYALMVGRVCGRGSTGSRKCLGPAPAAAKPGRLRSFPLLNLLSLHPCYIMGCSNATSDAPPVRQACLPIEGSLHSAASQLARSLAPQAPTADANAATSEGILVVSPTTAMSEGDLVRVNGTVSGMRPRAPKPHAARSQCTRLHTQLPTRTDSSPALPTTARISLDLRSRNGPCMPRTAQFKHYFALVAESRPGSDAENMVVTRLGNNPVVWRRISSGNALPQVVIGCDDSTQRSPPVSKIEDPVGDVEDPTGACGRGRGIVQGAEMEDNSLERGR